MFYINVQFTTSGIENSPWISHHTLDLYSVRVHGRIIKVNYVVIHLFAKLTMEA